MIYSEYAVDSKGKPYETPIIILEMHPTEARSISSAAQEGIEHGPKFKESDGTEDFADSVLRRTSGLRKDSES